ncbi:MAG: oxidoreductase [Rhodobacteraceae bacterium]|nr:oxidoreductase [Paracoccaceae bacterium]
MSKLPWKTHRPPRRAVLRAACLIAAGLAFVQPGPARADDPILTVDATGVGGTAKSFDLAALDALPQQRFRTSTPWTPGVDDYAGPSLKDVLDAAGAKSGVAVAVAINDYRIEIPVAEIEAAAPVVVTRINGETFSVRDKGPLWILYPFDSDSRYRTELNDARSIWQLTSITVRAK